MNVTRVIKGIEEFMAAIREDSSEWNPTEPKWFRGEPRSLTPLLPTLYREGLAAFENPLLQMFRSRASGYHDVVPDVERTDQWLFLARHAGLPTRLLDWTEGALIGLHFALQEREKEPVVWMLNPLELNELAGVSQSGDQMREFPLTWVDHGGANPAFENIAGAWVLDQRGVQLPVAVYPHYIHARLRAQRSCFTVHGKRKQGLDTLVPDKILKRYAVDPLCRESMLDELRTMGITDSVAFPDLDGLAKELKARFLK
jgi:FRG domain-containing protein